MGDEEVEKGREKSRLDMKEQQKARGRHVIEGHQRKNNRIQSMSKY